MQMIPSLILLLFLLVTLIFLIPMMMPHAMAIGKDSRIDSIVCSDSTADDDDDGGEVSTLSGITDDDEDVDDLKIIRTTYEIPFPKKNIPCISTGPPASQVSLIFTQGASGTIESPSVANFAAGFSELENITCFEGRANLQLRTSMFKTVIEHHHCNAIGGRSMGSRVAIATAKEVDNLKALILVSFPLKSTKGDNREHLLFEINAGIDVLFVIGDRDSLCDLNKLKLLLKQMKTKTWLLVVRNANHRMDIRPQYATKAVGRMVGKVVAKWIEEHDDTLRICEVHWDEDQNEVIVGPWTGDKF